MPVSPGCVAANTCWSPALTGEASPSAVSRLPAKAWPVSSLSPPSSFSRSERQLSLHQAEALAAGPLATIGLDVSPSTLIPFYDVDTSVAFFTGKVSQEGREILPVSGQGLWGHVQGSKAGHPAPPLQYPGGRGENTKKMALLLPLARLDIWCVESGFPLRWIQLFPTAFLLAGLSLPMALVWPEAGESSGCAFYLSSLPGA